MKRRDFERLVDQALDSLPDEFSSLLDNVAIFIADRPSRELLRQMELPPGETVFGLYEGVPLTERTHDYGLVTPDRITIFQRPIEEACATETEAVEQIRRTVLHEIAHFFGIDDDRLDEIEEAWEAGESHPGA